MKCLGKKIFLVFLLFLIGCAPKVIRTGYQISDENPDRNCDIIIKKFADIDENSAEVKGKIKIKDTGFSFNCEESDVIEILKKEACAANADIINIIDEQRADMLSSCYRVEAEFLKMKDSSSSANIKTDVQYNNDQISTRVKNDKNRKAAMIVVPIISSLISLGITFLLIGGQ